MKNWSGRIFGRIAVIKDEVVIQVWIVVSWYIIVLLAMLWIIFVWLIVRIVGLFL
jgi:hypothetical protein